MNSHQIGDHLILTEGRANSILVDFKNKKVAHITNRVKDHILSRDKLAIPTEIQAFLPPDFDHTRFAPLNFAPCQGQRKYQKLWFDISGVCNLRCRGCYAENYMYGSSSSFVSDELIQVIKQFGRYFESIDILGGEPFTNPRLLLILEEFCAAFDKVVIYTNGTIKKPDVIDLCKKEGILIKVSLYGITREDHEAFTRKPGSFDRTIDFLITCRDIGLRLRVGYLVTDICEIKDKKKIVEFLSNLGINYALYAERSRGKILEGTSPKRFFKFREKNQYLNNLFGHPCINQKMGIDVDGKLYHCPMERGHKKQSILELGLVRALEVIEDEWKQNLAARYSDCAVCEFRALCFDCFVLDPIADSHPVNCIYDPNQGNFRSLCPQ